MAEKYDDKDNLITRIPKGAGETIQEVKCLTDMQLIPSSTWSMEHNQELLLSTTRCDQFFSSPNGKKKEAKNTKYYMITQPKRFLK